MKLAPKAHAKTLATTTFAIVASIQLLALFVLWTPSGVIWWQAEGFAFAFMCGLYTVSWALLIWASFDAGAEVQSGAWGGCRWLRISKQFSGHANARVVSGHTAPIYVSFALTTWTVPVWTPDQLMLALIITGYCLLAPLLKERRFAQRYGAEFEHYKRRVPMRSRSTGSETRHVENQAQ